MQAKELVGKNADVLKISNLLVGSEKCDIDKFERKLQEAERNNVKIVQLDGKIFSTKEINYALELQIELLISIFSKYDFEYKVINENKNKKFLGYDPVKVLQWRMNLVGI